MGTTYEPLKTKEAAFAVHEASNRFTLEAYETSQDSEVSIRFGDCEPAVLVRLAARLCNIASYWMGDAAFVQQMRDSFGSAYSGRIERAAPWECGGEHGSG